MRRIKPWWFVNLLGAVMAAPFTAGAVSWLAMGHKLFSLNSEEGLRAFISLMLSLIVFGAADNMKDNAEKKNED